MKDKHGNVCSLGCWKSWILLSDEYPFFDNLLLLDFLYTRRSLQNTKTNQRNWEKEIEDGGKWTHVNYKCAWNLGKTNVRQTSRHTRKEKNIEKTNQKYT